MPINYYASSKGVFTVIADDGILAEVETLTQGNVWDAGGITALGQDLVTIINPASINGAILFNQNAIINDDRFGYLLSMGFAFYPVRLPAIQGTPTTELLPVSNDNDKTIILTYSQSDSNQNGLSVTQSETVQSTGQTVIGFNIYGVGSYNNFRSTNAGFITGAFIVANSNMSRFCLVSLTAGYSNSEIIRFQKNVPSEANQTILEFFFAGLTPSTVSDDPYAQIDGESDITGDSIGIPSFPSLGAVDTGIIGLFNPSAQQMRALSDFMWTDFGGTGTTVEDILTEVVQALKRSISNPLDYVIGFNIIPSQGLSVGGSKVIRFGFISSGVSMPVLSSQYFTVDCGSLNFDYLCGNTFLDYAPYSKFSIYLPYIGVKELDANDCVGHTIGVVYHGDVITGGITAYITKDGNVMYQYSGSCALNVPLSADNWGNTISAGINVATALVSGGLTGGAAGIAAAAVDSVANVAANPSQLSPQVARSGAISGGAGAMGVQKPYIIREAVRFHSTDGFNAITGYPSFYNRSLAEVSGYTKIYDIQLENIPATDAEIQEIDRLLKSGVIM